MLMTFFACRFLPLEEEQRPGEKVRHLAADEQRAMFQGELLEIFLTIYPFIHYIRLYITKLFHTAQSQSSVAYLYTVHWNLLASLVLQDLPQSRFIVFC